MARRKTKKERKKHLKEDQFRETMLSVGGQLKEYRYLILLALAVVVLFIVLLSMRSERRSKELAYAAQLIKPGTNTGPVELKKLTEQVKGTSIEPWVLLRYGTKLYELYQKEDSLSGEKERLRETKSIFEDITTRFPENGSAVYLAKRALELIEEEMAYQPPEALKRAYERATNPPPRRPPPGNIPKPPVPPKVQKKPDNPKEPTELEEPPKEQPSPKHEKEGEAGQAPETPEPGSQDK